MKDLLRKEHSSNKIHTLMKSSASPFYKPPPPPPPPILQETVDPSFYDFSKIPTPFKLGGIHTKTKTKLSKNNIFFLLLTFSL